MEFYFEEVLYHINTKNPNIVILPKGILFCKEFMQYKPAIAIQGNFLISLIRIIIFNGGISKATVVLSK
jgi:hypothetical protein